MLEGWLTNHAFIRGIVRIGTRFDHRGRCELPFSVLNWHKFVESFSRAIAGNLSVVMNISVYIVLFLFQSNDWRRRQQWSVVPCAFTHTSSVIRVCYNRSHEVSVIGAFIVLCTASRSDSDYYVSGNRKLYSSEWILADVIQPFNFLSQPMSNHTNTIFSIL